MAVFPKKLSLTRDQFASFLQDFEQIKQFEQLFSTTNANSISIDDVNISAGNAGEAANDALAQIIALSDTLGVTPPDLGGTVTSVAASGATTGLTFTGSPITTSGTLTLGGTLAVTNGGTGATNATDARFNLSAAKSGANSDITSLSGITGSISTVDSITFDTAAAITVGQGQIAWNADDGTINIGMGYDAVTQQVGLEQYFRIKASATITDGQCIMFTGSVGASGVLTGAPATGVSNPQYVMGVATMDIANNGFGYVTSFGLVRGINTTGSSVGETWVDGDILYYNPAFTGGLTKVPPAAPLPKVIVAAVVNAGPAGSGLLFIRVQGEPDLHNLSDVYAPSPISNGQILIGDGPQARWEATTLTPGSGVSITNAAGAITISATGSGGTVTSVSVVSANGFAGTVASATTTPAITLSTSVTGLIKGNGTALSAAVAATDYVAPSAYASANGLTMATSRLLGRTTAGTGAAEEISVAGGLTLSGGVLTGASGTVTSVTGTAPVVSSGGSTPAISMAAATTSVDGYLTSTDWNTFNNKGSGSVTSVSGTGTVNGITLTGTVTTSGSLTLGGTLSGVSLTSQVTGVLPVANGGTGTSTAFTTGSIVFAGTSGVYSQDNTNLFWDDTNNRLGVGTPTPGATIDVAGNIRMSAGSPNIELNNGGPMVYSPAGNTLSFATGGGPSTPQEKFRIGSSGQWGIGGATYGTSGQVFTSGGSGAAPTWTTPTTGTVTSVGGTGTVNGITLTGTVTSSGNLTLGGTLSGVSLTTQVSGTLPVANGGTGATTLTSGYLVKGNGTSAVSASVVYDDGTNVGIGTAAPGYKLEVAGNTYLNGIIRAAAASSAAAPGYTFAGDPDTGIFRSAANTIGISSNGLAVALVTPNTFAVTGNVIIDAGSLQTKANGSTALANALNDNLVITVGTGFTTFTGGGALAQLGGMVAGANGQRVVILNTTGSGITVIGESATSTAANRIWTQGLAPATWNNLGTREFIYSTAQSRWLMIGSNAN